MFDAVLDALPGAPFDGVFDVGGNVGEFAEAVHLKWPDAMLYSFEPIPPIWDAHVDRAANRWKVLPFAISDSEYDAVINFCANQHSASTMQHPGTARFEHFGIRDTFDTYRVKAQPLDAYYGYLASCTSRLVKIDVEGHEGRVIAGAERVLSIATTVICEVQNDPTIFIGSPSPLNVDEEMRYHGLTFAGICGSLASPVNGRILQFDGVWTRA